MATSGDPNSKSKFDTNIIKQHHDKLYHVLVLVDRDSFISFVSKMYTKNIVTIKKIGKNSTINSNKRGDGVDELLNRMEEYVSVKKDF